MSYFLITIDAEADNLWTRGHQIQTENALFLRRFQTLCESYDFKVTYLTDYRMASSPAFLELGREILKRGTGEIGMHLHAWDTPPFVPLTNDDFSSHPYLIEYPVEVMEQKITAMTDLLESAFGVRMVSHRAGRWSFDGRYARILAKRGYHVDCSVTPLVSWRHSLGNPAGKGGSDYTDFPDAAYFLELDDIRRAGHSSLLEIPVTIVTPAAALAMPLLKAASFSPLTRAAVQRIFPIRWLRPNGRNRKEMLDIVERAAKQRCDYIEFMLHSSELMPGGSPSFSRPENIEALYEDLTALFDGVRKHFKGATLHEYYRYYSMTAQRYFRSRSEA